MPLLVDATTCCNVVSKLCGGMVNASGSWDENVRHWAPVNGDKLCKTRFFLLSKPCSLLCSCATLLEQVSFDGERIAIRFPLKFVQLGARTRKAKKRSPIRQYRYSRANASSSSSSSTSKLLLLMTWENNCFGCSSGNSAVVRPEVGQSFTEEIPSGSSASESSSMGWIPASQM